MELERHHRNIRGDDADKIILFGTGDVEANIFIPDLFSSQGCKKSCFKPIKPISFLAFLKN